MKIPIHTPADIKMLQAEYTAYEENQLFDVVRAIRNRSMTREAYYKLWHRLRRFTWGLKHLKNVCASPIFE